MKWYAVCCRLEYDDEDSCCVYQAEGQDDAIRKAEHELRDCSESEDTPEDERKEFFLNYVCESDTEIRLTSYWP